MRLQHFFALYSVPHLRLALNLGVCRTRMVTGARTRVSSCVVRAIAPARVHARAHVQALAQHTRARARARTRGAEGRAGGRRTGASEHHVAHGPALSTPRLHGLRVGRVMPSGVGPCKRDESAALVGPLEGWRVASKAGATAQEEGKHPGPWLWHGWPRGAAAGEGGRRVNRLERTEPTAEGLAWHLCEGSPRLCWKC